MPLKSRLLVSEAKAILPAAASMAPGRASLFGFLANPCNPGAKALASFKDALRCGGGYFTAGLILKFKYSLVLAISVIVFSIMDVAEAVMAFVYAFLDHVLACPPLPDPTSTGKRCVTAGSCQVQPLSARLPWSVSARLPWPASRRALHPSSGKASRIFSERMELQNRSIVCSGRAARLPLQSGDESAGVENVGGTAGCGCIGWQVQAWEGLRSPAAEEPSEWNCRAMLPAVGTSGPSSCVLEQDAVVDKSHSEQIRVRKAGHTTGRDRSMELRAVDSSTGATGCRREAGSRSGSGNGEEARCSIGRRDEGRSRGEGRPREDSRSWEEGREVGRNRGEAGRRSRFEVKGNINGAMNNFLGSVTEAMSSLWWCINGCSGWIINCSFGTTRNSAGLVRSSTQARTRWTDCSCSKCHPRLSPDPQLFVQVYGGKQAATLGRQLNAMLGSKEEATHGRMTIRGQKQAPPPLSLPPLHSLMVLTPSPHSPPSCLLPTQPVPSLQPQADPSLPTTGPFPVPSPPAGTYLPSTSHSSHSLPASPVAPSSFHSWPPPRSSASLVPPHAACRSTPHQACPPPDAFGPSMPPHASCPFLPASLPTPSQPFRPHSHDSTATPDVIFLHGKLSSSNFWRDTVLSRFSPSFLARTRLLLPDLLGLGRSPAPPSDLYTLQDHVAALEASVLQRHQVRSFHLVAHSMGCIVALALAAAHVDRVRSITLVAPVYAAAIQDGGSQAVDQDGLDQTVGQDEDKKAGPVGDKTAGRDEGCVTAPMMDKTVVRNEGKVDAPTIVACGGGWQAPVRVKPPARLRSQRGGALVCERLLQQWAPRCVWPPQAFALSFICGYYNLGRTWCALTCRQHWLLEPLLRLLHRYIRPDLPFSFIEDFFQHTHHAAWCNFHSAIKAGAHALEPSLQRLQAARIPIHVVQGHDDPICPYASALQMAERFDNVHLHGVPGCDHASVVVGREGVMAQEIEEVVGCSEGWQGPQGCQAGAGDKSDLCPQPFPACPQPCPTCAVLHTGHHCNMCSAKAANSIRHG